jgi:hypothetical protein
MPSDNIKKAIMRGTGELEGGQIDEVMFEGYGPGGAAVLVNVATDNRNRTVSEIRHCFSKNGGNLGEQGSVAWMFERKSQIYVPRDKATEDQLMNIVLEAGADDLRDDGDQWEVLSDPEAHEAVVKAWRRPKSPRNRPKSPWCPRTWSSWKARTRAPCCGSARRWKSTTTCRTCTPTSISTRRSWRRWPNKCWCWGSIAARADRLRRDRIRWRRPPLVASGVISTNVKDPFEKRACMKSRAGCAR